MSDITEDTFGENTQKKIELIKFDEELNIQYQGICKVVINQARNYLIVKPIGDNEFKKIKASFKLKFVADKNILFVLAKHHHKSFVLIFNNDDRCKKVFDLIQPKKTKDKLRLITRFLTQIFKQNGKSGRIVEAFGKWLTDDSGNPRKEYAQLMKNKNVNDLFFPKKGARKRNLKRKHHEIVCDKVLGEAADEFLDDGLSDSDDENRIPQKKLKFLASSVKYSATIKYPNFKLMNIQERGSYRRLIIFADSTKTKCYEYIWYSEYKAYFCCGCQEKNHNTTAIIDQDSDGIVCAKLDDTKHVCTVLTKIPSIYTEIKIIRKPDYEILKDGTTVDEKLLIVFDVKDRNQCYEYFWYKRTEKFQCRGCRLSKINANICNEGSEKEYIELLNTNHVCEKRQFQTEKYFQFNEFVLPPNFAVHKKLRNRKERKTLIIFDKKDKTKAYTYFYNTPEDVFVCKECHRKKYVAAKLLKNDEGEEYVILSNVEHVCQSIPYSHEDHSDVIIHPPNYKYLEMSKSGIPKLFIFTARKLCYQFSFAPGINTTNRFYCRQCVTVANRSGTNHKVNAYLCKNDESGECYVRMAKKLHICKPKKYNPDLFDDKEIIKAYDFFFYHLKKQPDTVKVAVRNPANKKLCYTMTYSKLKRRFRCQRCEAKGNHFSFKLCKDTVDGKEYFIHNHTCKPYVTSVIRGSNIKIIDRKDINFEEKVEKKKKVQMEKVDESRIVKESNFELHPSRNGVPDGELIILCSNDKSMCFEYHNSNQSKLYRCGKCAKMKAIVTAKLFNDSNNGRYLVLNGNEHACKPIKYRFNNIKASDFIIYNKNDDTKPTYLIVFTNELKDLCYKFIYNKSENVFRCRKCLDLKTAVSVKLCTDKNGEEFLQLVKNQHICEPIKFVREEFEPKTIAESMFELHTNKNDGEGKLLVLFTSEKKDFVFHYYWFKENYYSCAACKRHQRFVTTRVFEKENGEKYLELSATEHGCTPCKYNPERYKDKDILYDNYCIQYNINGVAKSRLTIWNSDNKDIGYEYGWEKDKKVFICCGCASLKKCYITAKVDSDENGKEFLRLGKQPHICEIRNLRKKGLVLNSNEYKFENENTVITTTHYESNKVSYKFEYDSKMKTFCCIKCKEKKMFISATVCKDKNNVEFLLINDKHKCVTLL